MSRASYLCGMVLLFVALVLSFISSISLPYLPAIDFARVHFNGVNLVSGQDSLSEVRWGIWGPCTYDEHNDRTCAHTGHAYTFFIQSLQGQEIIIGSSWTRGLAIHPVATVIVAITFGFAASKMEHGPFFASLASFFAALVLLIAFAIDIALYAFIRHEIAKLKDVDAHVNAGTAFWMTFVSLILVLLAGCTVCFGRRKESGNDAYPMMSKTSSGFFSRFRKN
ncbi:hypothetical protein DFH07DRAFT_1001735 [Mycena maculata]|uniref:Pali-domain-containing protein n=1 Tax=Mycena maculata TaxID=230809 RepID=A0AAD7HSF2_9AGAR|nr:hypothetical protein DFH07DRAFT_1001735 [Mycena maculata]